MIISHKHRFIFIHNYKVAGTSMKAALAPYDARSFGTLGRHGKAMVKLGFWPAIYSEDFPAHIRAVELRERVPRPLFSRYFKFGFVRVPWDWQVSLYTFMLKNTEHPQHALVKGLADFDAYIDWRVHEDLHLQKEFFYAGDELLMDHVGRFEDMASELAGIGTRLGFEARLPHLNRSREGQHGHLRFYSPRSLGMVEEAFREDIDLFGYPVPSLAGTANAG
ncbi:MAG: sulfotransferase family 2 domain-containing protein [Flavobacteriales bacterium]|nr:sulfotransferase family 2 domain-containing protein [Flavobacteriales bacterium]